VVKTGEADDAGIEQIRRIVKPMTMGDIIVTEFPAGGTNTIITDDLGRPSVMVRIPKFKWSDVFDGAEDETCSAFIVGGREVDCIYISKYLNVVEYGRAYSLPMRDPANSITLAEAREACMRKGKGWHLLTNAEWCAIALLCEKRGLRPGGNTEKGRDFFTHEVGIPAHGGHRIDESITERTLTGTGPASWSHDGTPDGIYDMAGNVWEHVAGLRLVDGEIQIVKDNDSALGVDEDANSEQWRAITMDGRLVTPGSGEKTYKYDSVREGTPSNDITALPDGFVLSDEVTRPQYTGKDAGAKGPYAVMPLRELRTHDGSAPAPILKRLGLAPVSEDIPEQLMFIRNYGERMPQRGGSWYDIKFAGMWELYMRDGRDYVYPDMGFRSAYVNLV